MASASDNLTGLKNTLSSNNAVYATIKPQYTGSWHDDLLTIGNMVGKTPAQILKLNQWLTDNNFAADNRQYITLKLKEGDAAGAGSSVNGTNDRPTGYYTTNSWLFPLGVGTWYCSTGYSSTHTALDFTTGTPGVIQGRPIYATRAGTVVSVSKNSEPNHGGGWGNSILIRHDETKDSSGNCYYSRVAHMISEPTKKVGDKISQGDKLGNVGNTGKSTGPHLHFQIYWTSADRTDYGNFTGRADFSVDPNTLSDFPGIPWKESNYSQINYAKSEYVTDAEIDVAKRLMDEDSEVTQLEVDTAVNNISQRIIQAENITDDDVKTIIKQYIEAQFDNLKSNGWDALNSLLQGGNFYTVFNDFVNKTVNDSKLYIYSKVGEQLTTAGQEFIDSTKAGLKSFIFDGSNIDPNSELGTSLGTYLDSYVDAIVANGWSAVNTAITTGDVEQAAQVFLTQTKNESIDFASNTIIHGCATAITSYVEENIGAPSDSRAAQVAVDLGIGIVNVVVYSIGGVLKGEITVEQAAKNIVNETVRLVTKTALREYLSPLITDWLTTTLKNAIIKACTDAGITIGGSVEPIIGSIIGAIVGYVVGLILDWLADQLIGFFTQG